MKRQDLITALAKKQGTSRAAAAELVDFFFATEGVIATELRRGGRVQISGFGAFEARRRAARKGRNPATGREIAIRAAVVPAFRPGTALKDFVNRRRSAP